MDFSCDVPLNSLATGSEFLMTQGNHYKTRPIEVPVATKPTRLQQQARDHLAETLFLITEAYRLDGKGTLSRTDFDEIAARIARVSSAFSLDEIVVRALERRAKALALTSGSVDLIALQDGEPGPVQALLIPDHELRELVQRLEEELGVL